MNSRTTRYAEVAVDLERKISSGDYASGTLLPTEAALCESYGISRFTARAALKSLAEKGLIERRQGRGSVVLNTRPSVFRSAWSTIDELLEHAEQVRVVIDAVAEVEADEDTAEKTGFKIGQKLLHIKGLRYTVPEGCRAETPLCTLDVWLHHAYSDLREELHSITGSVIGLLEKRYGKQTVEVHQRIAAVLLPEDIADCLGVDAGQAALRLRRQFINLDGEIFEASETVFPSSHFEYQMKMKR
ncbi:GntR family transcriptional regulator [Halomonas daqingensis]|uniref:GntR family transcriptional regulator n=1 Tax=Billgrantia desiderata TaxID=52021 RepID=A0ABS9B8K2_9GAMM|nr:GntR family transcriptional regulator [Halomonas desiderata]MCE8043977.1 GntR family transcriptional regulator [Halomonas desiderata]MCE8048551.1 GntR family transcriptional regulator [Halomonas desiderata]